MKYIFRLSGQNLELASKEIQALADIKTRPKKQDRLLISEIGNIDELKDRLAYTHVIYQFLFETNKNTKSIIKAMQEFDWNSIYKKDFSLRILNQGGKELKQTEKELAGYIWDKIKRPKVNLNDAKTQIVLINTKDKIYCGLVCKKLDKSFLKRKAHLKPELVPTSLDPGLARAMINIAGIKKNQTLADPFCGSGGILIESALMGFKTTGYDIDDMVLKKAELNIKHYKIKNCQLKKKDATKIKARFDYIVTDLPYGRNSKQTKELECLYKDFIKTAYKIIKRKAVIIFPDFINYKPFISSSKFKLEKKFTQYLHKSLSKNILLLKK